MTTLEIEKLDAKLFHLKIVNWSTDDVIIGEARTALEQLKAAQLEIDRLKLAMKTCRICKTIHGQKNKYGCESEVETVCTECSFTG